MPAPSGAPRPRPYLGILFDCCNVYARIYRTPDESAYSGRCPRCLREVTARVGEAGTDARFFRAS